MSSSEEEENKSSVEVPEGWTQEDTFILDDSQFENEFDMIDTLSTLLDQVTRQLDEQRQELLKAWKTTSNKKAIRGLENRRNQILSLMIRQYNKLDQRMNRDAKTIQLRDKIAFVIGVGNTCVAPALALRYPHLIPLYYTAQFSVLLVLRYFIYRSRQWHYFIFDNCYFVNIMSILFVWLLPSSRALFIACFCMTNGPVAWAIITWRNSLVFHSLDKVTSLFIHIFPPLVMYCVRWMPELLRDIYCENEAFVTAYRNGRYPALVNTDLSLKETLIYSTIAFATWQILYYIFIMIGRRAKVEAGLRLTSYSWLLGDEHGKKTGFIQRAAFIFGPKWKMEMFVVLQTVYSILTFIPTFFLFQYFWLHSIFLMVMFAVSVWNGANYYIEVFSRRYITELEKRKSEESIKLEEDAVKSEAKKL